MRILNSLKVPNFGKIFEKRSHKAEKSHGAEKSENRLLRNTCKKMSAYPRVRKRNLWVEKQASYH